MSKTKLVLAVIINALIFTFMSANFIAYFFMEPNLLIDNGFDSMRYFTTDSNLFAAIASLIMLFFEIRILTKKADHLPKAAVVIKTMAASAVLLTFVITALFLAPTISPKLLWGQYFYVHVAGPLMSFFSVVLLETAHKLRIREMLLGLIPMLTYGAVYLIMTSTGVWKEFYRFSTMVNVPVASVILVASAAATCLVTGCLHNVFVKRTGKRSAKNSPAVPDDTQDK